MARLSKFNKIEESLPDISCGSLTSPYTAITSDIQITVWPEFIDSKSSVLGDLFIWAYHIRIDNKSLDSIKLLNRHWRIFDEKGNLQEVSGEGVVGEQPLIRPNCSYQYSSGVHLRHPSGIMTGEYQMKKIGNAVDDKIFNVRIPTFSLDVPSVKGVIN